MFDDEHNSDSGQEQNYDYIFEALERQEMLDSGKPMLISPDGKAEHATVSKVLKAWMPAIIFLAAISLIVFASKFDDMLAIAMVGFLFMGVTGWKSFSADKKFRPHPILMIVFIVGTAMVYSAVATMIHRKNPFFDMNSFQLYSVLGFGIGILLCGIVMLSNEILKAITCRTEITAQCTKIQNIGYQNGRPFGNVTWTYEYEGVSYTETTYNTMLATVGEGMEEKICIDPAHPKRLRRKGSRSLRGWAIGFVIVGIMLIVYYTVFV